MLIYRFCLFINSVIIFSSQLYIFLKTWKVIIFRRLQFFVSIFLFISLHYQKYLSLFFLICSVLLSYTLSLGITFYSPTTLSAQDELSNSKGYYEEPKQNLYQIEYIIFEQLHTDRHVLRYEDVQYDLPQRAEYLHLLPPNQVIAPNQLKQLPVKLMDLGQSLQRLEKSKEVNVYAFGAWQQEIKKGERLLPLQVNKDMSAQGGQHLTGEIFIRRGRYIHADVNLYLNDFVPLPYKNLQTWIFQSDAKKLPLDWLLQPLAFHAPNLEDMGEFLLPQNVIQLHQNRRIKEGEVHYLDHPALGVIIVIKQIESLFLLSSEGFDDISNKN